MWLFSDGPYRSSSLAKSQRGGKAHMCPGRAQPQPMTLTYSTNQEAAKQVESQQANFEKKGKDPQ